MKCNTCQNERYCYDGNHQLTRDGCADNGFAAYVPQTNYDLLISKTPEDLVEYIRVFFPEICPPGKCPGEDHCYKCWLDWLKSPVEEVDE